MKWKIKKKERGEKTKPTSAAQCNFSPSADRCPAGPPAVIGSYWPT